MSPVKKICPKIEELSSIDTNVKCPEDGCGKIFSNTSNLSMHVLKHHKKGDIEAKKQDGEGTVVQFHCPIDNCLYSVESERFFSKMKYLKQHFLKVHAAKKFSCTKCKKGFPTKALMRHHSNICGVKFICSCGYEYDHYEALLTHARRQNHTFDEKYKLYAKRITPAHDSSMNMTTEVCKPGTMSTDTSTLTGASQSGKCQQYILPNIFSNNMVMVPVHLLAAVALSELSQTGLKQGVNAGVQTDLVMLENKRTRKNISPAKTFENSGRSVKRKASTQTQTKVTGRNKRPKISAETQTSGDYILKRAMRAAHIPISRETRGSQSCPGAQHTARKRKKSMETQTVSVVHPTTETKPVKTESEPQANFPQYQDSVTQSTNFDSLNEFSTPNAPLPDNIPPYPVGMDVGLPDLWMAEKNSSGTQTSPVMSRATSFIEQELANSVTQTDFNLSFLEPGNCDPMSGIEPANSINASPQNLSNYYTENCNSNFTADDNIRTPTYETNISGSSCMMNLDSLGEAATDEILRFLTQERKANFDVNQSCSTETQTELDLSNSFFTECTDEDTTFTHCSNIETQTTEDFDVYANMYTQTCDDILLSDLGFVDIQTQTAWSQYSEDLNCVSTETQTSISGLSPTPSGSKLWYGSKGGFPDTTNMETQTNVDELRTLLAELAK